MGRLLIVSLALLAVGCKKAEPASAPPAAASQPGKDTLPRLTQPGQAESAAGKGLSLAGKVLERIDSASYSYLRLETVNGELWAAVPETTVKVGTPVTVVNAMSMDGFESKTLKRKFEKIVFGSLAETGEAAPPQVASGAIGAAGASDPGVPPPHATPVKEVGPIAVAKAEGPEGRTVAELFKQKGSLKDKTVAVRGKVVKFTAGVMGVNWLHLRDGSGSESAGDHDITVTTQANAAVGDVVLVKGPLHLDKDFGAGYSYAAIIEGATVAK